MQKNVFSALMIVSALAVGSMLVVCFGKQYRKKRLQVQDDLNDSTASDSFRMEESADKIDID